MAMHRTATVLIALILLFSVATGLTENAISKDNINTPDWIIRPGLSRTHTEVDGGVLERGDRDNEIPPNNDFNVLLKARYFVPARGISTALKANLNKITAVDSTKRTHVLMQFERIPTLKEREELKREGIELPAYIPNNTWYVSVPAGKASQIVTKSLVRAMDVIKPEYKISPYIQENKIGEWAIDELNYW